MADGRHGYKVSSSVFIVAAFGIVISQIYTGRHGTCTKTGVRVLYGLVLKPIT